MLNSFSSFKCYLLLALHSISYQHISSLIIIQTAFRKDTSQIIFIILLHSYKTKQKFFGNMRIQHFLSNICSSITIRLHYSFAFLRNKLCLNVYIHQAYFEINVYTFSVSQIYSQGFYPVKNICTDEGVLLTQTILLFMGDTFICDVYFLTALSMA